MERLTCNKLPALIVLLLLTGACRKTETPATNMEGMVIPDSIPGLVVADTIIYDVIIRNQNPDDTWAVHCLEGLNHRLLIDNIFGMIYSGKTIAYNHETHEKLTPRQVEKIEAADDYSRENIGMIQFTEMWYLNPVGCDITKKVISMVLGYNYFTPEGERFYKALFRVEMGK